MQVCIWGTIIQTVISSPESNQDFHHTYYHIEVFRKN